MDLKGFEHLGVAWSWPEFDEPSGTVTRPAHAWAREGKTRCGEPWPHSIYLPRLKIAVEIDPHPRAPKPERIAQIRDAEDRTAYMCSRCLGVTPQGR